MRLFSSLIINYSFKKVVGFSFSLPIVQCSPFQPGLHSHLPSRHVPCSLQRGWHARWSQAVPIHPSSQRQVPPTQMPCPPQSAAQISVGEERRERRGDGWREGRGVKSRVLFVKKSSHTSLPRLMGQWKEFLEVTTLILPDNKNLISILQKRDGHGLQRSAVIDPPICFLILLHSSSFCDHQIQRRRLFQQTEQKSHLIKIWLSVETMCW